MKAQSMTLSTAGRLPGRSVGLGVVARVSRSLPCLAALLLASALPPVALVVLAAWAGQAPALLPVAQAAVGLGGFVFLALMVDAEKSSLAPLGLTAAALFALALASRVVAADLVTVGAMLLAAWLGSALFGAVRRTCL